MASESDVIGWLAGWDALLLVEMVEEWEVRESTLGRLGLCSCMRAGGLFSGGSLLTETTLELDGEGERVEDRSWEGPGDVDLASLPRLRPRKPDKRSPPCESAIEWASSLLNWGEKEGEPLAWWSTPGMER